MSSISIATTSTSSGPKIRASAKPIAPVPHPTSRMRTFLVPISLLSSRARASLLKKISRALSAAYSTNSSVSGLGQRQGGQTLSVKSRKSHLPRMYCRGSMERRREMWEEKTLASSSLKTRPSTSGSADDSGASRRRSKSRYPPSHSSPRESDSSCTADQSASGTERDLRISTARRRVSDTVRPAKGGNPGPFVLEKYPLGWPAPSKDDEGDR
mmetsp:Transcript_59922/g.177676  ORF Transcript_59922/g.177676 Transcript_59922/m.177676 type:complete len:213 (-) Transcript_59922:483-1121(-)